MLQRGWSSCSWRARVTPVLSAPREIRQGGTPSIRRRSTPPRQCPRAPLLAPTTGLSTVAHGLGLETVRAAADCLCPPGAASYPLPACHTAYSLQGRILGLSPHARGPPGLQAWGHPCTRGRGREEEAGERSAQTAAQRSRCGWRRGWSPAPAAVQRPLCLGLGCPLLPPCARAGLLGAAGTAGCLVEL